MNIPDEAVEVAARAVFDRNPSEATWDGSRQAVRDYYLDDARAALSAAAPFIAAQVLREASDAYPLETAYGGAEHAVLWLKGRAEGIRKA